MDLSIRARAATAIFDMATFGFNPGQKRGPDGRFIKMGGRGSAGKGGLPKGARPSEGGGAGAGGGGGTLPAATPPPPAPAAPRRMDELDRRIADNEQLINEPGEEYLADRRRADLEIQKKARATFGDPEPGETDAEHEARVFSKIKAAAAVVDDAKAAGWVSRVTHGTDISGMPFVTVEVGNPDTKETFSTTWHTRKNGTYQLFSQSTVTRVSDKGIFEGGRRYGSERTPTKLREIMAQEPAAGAPAAPANPAAATPGIGSDGQYVKPVKQVATWNGQVETRTSRHPYNYVSVVQFGGDEPVILSWHRTRAAAEKGTLTKNQRDNGSRVVAVAEVKPEQPGENASASAEAQRLDRLVKNATTMYGSDESKWPARAQQDVARLRKKRAAMSSDADVFAMPDDLADHWIHGEGAAKIRWCTEGAFERARRALREHVPAPMLDGTVANLYKRACGKWPGQDRDQ
jgi:hypothetical protein